MNVVILSGRLSKDPDVRYTQGGMCWASFTVAVSNPGKDKGTSFINCKAFEKTAESIEKNAYKGRLIGVVGRIQTGSYVAKDGHKVFTTDVMVDRVEYFDKKQEVQPDEIDKGASVQIEGFSQFTDDDIPF